MQSAQINIANQKTNKQCKIFSIPNLIYQRRASHVGKRFPDSSIPEALFQRVCHSWRRPQSTLRKRCYLLDGHCVVAKPLLTTVRLNHAIAISRGNRNVLGTSCLLEEITSSTILRIIKWQSLRTIWRRVRQMLATTNAASVEVNRSKPIAIRALTLSTWSRDFKKCSYRKTLPQHSTP